jgi:hypothetical protein
MVHGVFVCVCERANESKHKMCADCELMRVEVLYWLSFKCVVGLLRNGGVYHFWCEECMTASDARKLSVSTPTGPVQAFVCGNLRWNQQRAGFVCERITAAVE